MMRFTPEDLAFVEAPEDLRLNRDPNPHLTFGAGIHLCLGAPLGRLELQTSFGAPLSAFPAVAPVDEPRWKPGT